MEYLNVEGKVIIFTHRVHREDGYADAPHATN